MKKYIVVIEGMSCSHCENHIENKLSSLDPKMKIKASAKDKSAEILSDKDISDNEFKTAVESAGYVFKEVLKR